MKIKNKIIIILLLSIALFAIYITYNNVKHKTNQTVTQHPFDIVFGNPEAKLKVYMYYDFNCTFCRKFFNQTYNQLKPGYIDNNKIAIIVKPVCLVVTEQQFNATKALICLNNYGNPEPLHKLLLTEPNVIYNVKFANVIDELMATDNYFANCMLSGESEEYLLQNNKQFIELGFTATPTFVINNYWYKGFKNINNFITVINKAIN